MVKSSTVRNILQSSAAATGEALATVDYIPDRYPLNGWNGHGGNGGSDSTGNRVDRFLACVAYLDGVHPSVVMCRGYYGRSVLAAWDWRNGKLTSRWVFDSKDGENPYSGQGNHNLSVTDVDGDGKDEIIYGSMVVDDNGKGLFSTGFRHGDAIHVGELDSGSSRYFRYLESMKLKTKLRDRESRFMMPEPEKYYLKVL